MGAEEEFDENANDMNDFPRNNVRPKNLPPGHVWVDVDYNYLPVDKDAVRAAINTLHVRSAFPSGEAMTRVTMVQKIILCANLPAMPDVPEKVFGQLAVLTALTKAAPIRITNEGILRWAYNSKTSCFTWAPYAGDQVQQALATQNRNYNHEPIPGLTRIDHLKMPVFIGKRSEYNELWEYVQTLRRN